MSNALIRSLILGLTLAGCATTPPPTPPARPAPAPAPAAPPAKPSPAPAPAPAPQSAVTRAPSVAKAPEQPAREAKAPLVWTVRVMPRPVTYDPALMAQQSTALPEGQAIESDLAPAIEVKQNPVSAPINPRIDPTNPDSVGGLMARRSVYFEIDSTQVPQHQRPIIAAHGAWLARNPATRIRLSGHCDERGSREYNLSLGERRALAVKGLLVLSGVEASHIQIESFGKEKPASLGHSEAAWTRNRRVDIHYQDEP